MGVKAMTEPRRVEGPLKSRADAEVTGDLWTLAGKQEDVIFLSEGDKARVRDFVSEAVQAITLSYAQPCRWWQFGCKAARKKLEQED